jgi:hypothetical protein
MALEIMKKMEPQKPISDTTAPVSYIHPLESTARVGALLKARQALAKMHGETDIEKVPYRIVHDKMYQAPGGKYESEIRLIKLKD